MNATATPEAPAAVSPSQGLPWSDQFRTGDGRMDDTHEEFVQMLNQLLALPESEQLPLYLRFVDHTVEHFAQEERWMVAIGFAPDNCHASHHATILETLRAVTEHYEKGDTDIINRLAEALVEWFPQHAATMDAGLALHMKEVGFDSRTETLADPGKVRPATMSGCGSVSCS
ncbi:hemerythrin domain-containing protein [Hydrogenophaga sp. NFH-34]|uniref:hemerythrin domain-containing protein n=1 Tax=Hydrogenophaga sp. NFH-34 TaxID=2744446 RepID=UPI001F2F94DB|nr:hemerythrin domain-containing protein [Hydrogenophaga sp. NFH-34]